MMAQIFLLESVLLSMQMHFSWGHPHSPWKGIRAVFVARITQQLVQQYWFCFQINVFFYCLLSGSLCDGTTSQCYLLPVLDTIFVRRKYRRDGLGMKMLHDFCQSFMAEDALGISCPISAAMYQGKSFDVEMLGRDYV